MKLKKEEYIHARVAVVGNTPLISVLNRGLNTVFAQFMHESFRG